MNIDLTATSRCRPATAHSQTGSRLGMGYVASHSLYSPASAAIRSSDVVRPALLTATLPGDGASRRCVLSENRGVLSESAARPLSQGTRTVTQLSSPLFLKQLAGLQMAGRRSDYGQENARLVEVDGAANAAAYARARARDSSSPKGSPARSEEEVTPEGDLKPPPIRCAGNARRRLQLRDASAFYAARPSTASLACKSEAYSAAGSQPPAPSSISRQHAIAAARSDPFGHSVSGRGHWLIGPTVR